MRLFVILFVFGLFSCEQKKASWETQEDARRVAKENAEFNAKQYRKEHRPGWRIVNRGDSSIKPECPQGDGWVSVDLVSPKNGNKIQLKCSSVSEVTGCLAKKDFDKRDYAEQDGTCNKEIPFPLPKIVK